MNKHCAQSVHRFATLLIVGLMALTSSAHAVLISFEQSEGFGPAGTSFHGTSTNGGVVTNWSNLDGLATDSGPGDGFGFDEDPTPFDGSLMAIALGQGSAFATVEMDLDNSQNLSLTNFVYANRGGFPPRLLVDYFGVNDEFLGTNSYSFGPGPRVENSLPVEPWGVGVIAGDPSGFPFFQLITPTEPFQGVPLGKVVFRSFHDPGYSGEPGNNHGIFMLDAVQLDAATTTFNPNGYARLSFDEFAAHADGDSIQGASIPGFIDNLALTAVDSANPIAEKLQIDHGPGNGILGLDCCGFRHPETEPEPIFGEHIAFAATQVNDSFGNSALEIDMDNSAALSPVSFYFAYRGNGVPDVIIEYIDLSEQSLGTETFNGSDDGGAGLGLSPEFYPEFDQIVVGSPVSSNLTVGSVVGVALSKMIITVDNKGSTEGQHTSFSMDDLLFACTTGPCPTVGNGTPCDFNSDEDCNATDINLLAAAVRNGTSDSKFNVDGQGDPNIPDDSDFAFYITDETMLSTGFGDGDLNMIVNFNDFVQLSNNFDMTGTGWSEGNFNTDDNTNFNDFVALSNNFGESFAAGGADVPEPTVGTLLILSVLAALRRRYRSH